MANAIPTEKLNKPALGKSGLLPGSIIRSRISFLGGTKNPKLSTGKS